MCRRYKKPPGVNRAAPHGSELDPRLVFLARCHARFVLVEPCAMTLDEAWDGLFGPVPDPWTELLLS